MPSGGARARSGPAADPQSIRSLERGGENWTRLPRSGRSGRAPRWPLPTPATPAEAKIWRAEWKRPQAIQWEINGQELEVALYVRRLMESQAPGSTAAVSTLVVRQQEALGISLPGLARNRWLIVPDATIARDNDDSDDDGGQAAGQPAAPRMPSSRGRLQSVPSGPDVST